MAAGLVLEEACAARLAHAHTLPAERALGAVAALPHVGQAEQVAERALGTRAARGRLDLVLVLALAARVAGAQLLAAHGALGARAAPGARVNADSVVERARRAAVAADDTKWLTTSPWTASPVDTAPRGQALPFRISFQRCAATCQGPAPVAARTRSAKRDARSQCGISHEIRDQDTVIP